MSFGEQNTHLVELVETLPTECCNYIFAYGSGAVAQKGQNPRKNMVDFIISVPDTVEFHKRNIKNNAFHYSFVRFFGPNWNGNFNRNRAARVYYNTLVKVPPSGRLMKYGVIQTNDLVADLLDWQYLYISGRLHKPVVPIVGPNIEGLTAALKVNLKSAVHASLLLLPEVFTTEQLYERITSLSYSGDFRSLIGEDRNKITNIVRGQMDRFELLYTPLLAELPQIHRSNDRVYQDLSEAAVYHHLNLLPKQVLCNFQSADRPNRDLEDIIFALANSRDYADTVQRSINTIVASSSFRQSVKNVATAGFTKTIIYSFQKLSKMIRSIR